MGFRILGFKILGCLGSGVGLGFSGFRIWGLGLGGLGFWGLGFGV